MEAAQLSPHVGERPGDPETLEAGDTEPNGGNETTCHGDGGTQGCKHNQGPHDPRARSHESSGARDSRVWDDETPGAGHNEGSRSPRVGNDEGSEDSGSWGGQVCGDPGTRSDEGRSDERPPTRSDEGPPTRSNEGPLTWIHEGHPTRSDEGHPTRIDEGHPTRIDEGHPTRIDEGHPTRINEGPPTRIDEGPPTRIDEGHLTRIDEGHPTRIDEGPPTRSDEGPPTRSDEGPPTRSDEGPPTRSDEGPPTRSDEGPPTRSDGHPTRSDGGHPTRSDEGPPTRSDEGPLTRSNETTRSPRSNYSKGTSPVSSGGPQRDETSGPRSGCYERTSPISSEGPRDPGAISRLSEEPANPSDRPCALPNDAGGTIPAQRLTGSSEPQGTFSARGRGEGPDDVRTTESCDSGSKDPTEPRSESSEGENGSRGSTLESSSEGAESFKKPIAPCRSGWNEKTLEQRNKPSCSTPISLQPSPPVSGCETASDHSARLPSDAYRSSPAIPYREPAWSGLPQALYSLEVLKGGSILSTKSLSGASWTVFGRLPSCHVSLEHPSVSRYHAVLQYRSVPGSEPDQDPGYYVYDLGSTHGTFINKQRIQSKTYSRLRVGHVLKFGGSSRLFILQGPDEDQEAESDLTVTQIKEARRQKESLQRKMLGDDSDEEDSPEEGEEKERKDGGGSEGASCMWGMGEDAMEEETDVNPIAVEYLAEREASYSGNPKKALQGFFDREGEELDFEYEEQGIGSWLCRVKLPVDDSAGKQLVAEVVHSGKKRDAMKLCSLEACRMLDMRGLLRQEAVSRKRKAKQWEAEDFYDSDDDTFLDRTGMVEKKRLNRMKKAGKVEEKPETYESLTAKLDLVEKEIVEIAAKLKTNQQGEAQTSSQDSLDAFMTEIKSGSSIDSVTRKKLHLQSLELKKEQQRLKSLIKIVQPTRLPELKDDPSAQDSKTKKLTLPMFGAMKGGSKFKLKTGTVGKLPPKRTDLPSSLFTMKGDSNEPEEEEEEEEEEDDDDDDAQMDTASNSHTESKAAQSESMGQNPDPGNSTCPTQVADVEEKIPTEEPKKKTEAPSASHGTPKVQSPPAAQTEEAAPKATTVRQRKMLGPSRPPQGALSARYPEDDPDYCVWTPPAGQTGDGKTHLNEKYGY